MARQGWSVRKCRKEAAGAVLAYSSIAAREISKKIMSLATTFQKWIWATTTTMMMISSMMSGQQRKIESAKRDALLLLMRELGLWDCFGIYSMIHHTYIEVTRDEWVPGEPFSPTMMMSLPMYRIMRQINQLYRFHKHSLSTSNRSPRSRFALT